MNLIVSSDGFGVASRRVMPGVMPLRGSLSGAGPFVMELPNLRHDFHHALIDSVRIGPRREVTMTIQALLWEGQRGHRSPDIYLRCGGVVNFDEVKAFFGKYPSLELAWLDYAQSQKSKPGDLFIELQSERTGDKLIIQCSSINVADSE